MHLPTLRKWYYYSQLHSWPPCSPCTFNAGIPTTPGTDLSLFQSLTPLLVCAFSAELPRLLHIPLPVLLFRSWKLENGLMSEWMALVIIPKVETRHPQVKAELNKAAFAGIQGKLCRYLECGWRWFESTRDMISHCQYRSFIVRDRRKGRPQNFLFLLEIAVCFVFEHYMGMFSETLTLKTL